MKIGLTLVCLACLLAATVWLWTDVADNSSPRRPDLPGASPMAGRDVPEGRTAAESTGRGLAEPGEGFAFGFAPRRTDSGLGALKPPGASAGALPDSATSGAFGGGKSRANPPFGASAASVSAGVAAAISPEPIPVLAATEFPPMPVPPGARLPAVFQDNRPLPPPQRRALDRLANEFINAVASTAATGADFSRWEVAREEADRQYIKLYGHAFYNSLHLQAAKEAAREKRTTGAAP